MTTSTKRGNLVARKRVAAGLSQEELARLCQCSVRTIVRVERGDSASMSQRIRSALAEHLDVTLRSLADEQRRSASR